MKNRIGLALVILLGLTGQQAFGGWLTFFELDNANRRLHGRILDFTNNHGKDRRIWSAALGAKRDLYVYLPPNFDPHKKYPLGIFLHGAGQDEQFFLKSVAKGFDQAIAEGRLGPCIVAAPDGSMYGRPSFLRIATFYANTDAGRFEDYIMEDVWNFLMTNFPIRREREAHAMMGASMGGSAAFAHAIKHRDKIGTAMGFLPALNLRWVDCHGHYQAPFDPNCWGWREKPRPFEVIGYPRGLIKIRAHDLFGALVGHGPDSMKKLAQFNPIELMDVYDLKDGELNLYVAYGGKDEFNIPAQVESFLYRARQRGISVGVGYDPKGRHNAETGRRLLPAALEWVAPRMMPVGD
jgi:S-formylglutathione hydrolase FrmB